MDNANKATATSIDAEQKSSTVGSPRQAKLFEFARMRNQESQLCIYRSKVYQMYDSRDTAIGNSGFQVLRINASTSGSSGAPVEKWIRINSPHATSLRDWIVGKPCLSSDDALWRSSSAGQYANVLSDDADIPWRTP